MTKLRVIASQRRPKASAAESPEIAVESLYDVKDELVPLFVRFWQERDRDGLELSPDWENLLRMTALGTLHVVTIRDDGIMCGFLLNIIQPRHLFYKSMVQGTTLAYWLDPLYRVGMFPLKAFRFNLDILRKLGCKRVFIAADLAFRNGRTGLLFQRLGYAAYETHYAKVF